MKASTKYKPRPKNETKYNKTIVFKCEPSYEERESIIRRAIYREQDLYPNKPLRWIVAEKDFTKVSINFFVKK
jgi:hypothetical protein